MFAVAESNSPEFQETGSWNLSFPTRLAAPQQTGVIRREPEHFRVVENLDFELTGEGEHVYFDIEKRSANTAWVAWQLSEQLGIPEKDIGYAGRKDRHAITRQWFSAYMPGKSIPELEQIVIEGTEILAVERHQQKLRQGQLRSNRFEIFIETDSSPESQPDIDARLQQVRADGFPNYFGQQRFGKDGSNLDLAEKLLVNRGKLKGDRGMAISAARAWLFNQYLADQVQEGADIVDMTGPLIGKVRDPQAGEDRLDEHMRLWVAGLRRLGSKAAERALCVVPEDFDWHWSDAGITLRFELPPGAFATSLLSEIFVIQDVAS